MADFIRRLCAEALGTCLLVAVVVGSGIMGAKLSGGNDALALIGNTLATGAILVVLITIFAPVSGAHFNPAVSLVFALRRELGLGAFLSYVPAQIAGGIAGTALAHAMFALFPLIGEGMHVRAGAPILLGEIVATFALVLTILGTLRAAPERVALNVGLVISAGYWFTSSTSFANPAVTLARALTPTFSGIRPEDAPLFMAGQILGAVLAAFAAAVLFPRRAAAPSA